MVFANCSNLQGETDLPMQVKYSKALLAIGRPRVHLINYISVKNKPHRMIK